MTNSSASSHTELDHFSRLGLTSYEASLLINKSYKAFNTLLKTCLSHHGLTIPEWSLLGRLCHEGSLRPGEAAAYLGVTAPFASTLVQTLTQQGLIDVAVYADDERSKILTLTTAGKAKVAHVEPLLQACLNGQFTQLEQRSLEDYFTTAAYMAQHVAHH